MSRVSGVILAALLVVSAAVVCSDVAAYRSLKSMRAEIHGLQHEVNETARLVQEQGAAVAASNRSAQEAAARAAVAADARQNAETGRQQAEAASQQAAATAEQAHQQAYRAEQKMTAMQQERNAELDRMQQALNSVAETHRTTNGMVVLLPNSTFRFDFDKSDLTEHNRELLSRIAGILLASKGYGLSVFGYTDDVGSPEYNQQLSLRRAEAVKNYLVEAGVDRTIVNVKGYGKTSPLIASAGNDARAKNRRVEIAVTDSSLRFDQ